MRVHHVGYAVKDIEKSMAAFERLGYECGKVVEDDIRQVKIVFLQNGSERVELVAPNGDADPVAGVLKKNGAMPYHICYEVDDLEDAIADLKAQRGWMLTKAPEVAPAIGGKRVAFMYQKDVGILELVEA